jgi:type III pantothenate kinase
LASAQLPRLAIGRPDRVIGKTTVQAMRSGIFWGYVGLVEGMIERIRGEFGEPLGVVATGGLAALFSECSAQIDHSDPDLTLKGLLTVYRRNQGR